MEKDIEIRNTLCDRIKEENKLLAEKLEVKSKQKKYFQLYIFLVLLG